MEKWQKDHLTRKRARLVKETICNELIFSHLLSEGVLAKVDAERIKHNNDRYQQAALLFDIVETRQNGYVGMARALAKVKQTGPLQVFMDGFARHVIPSIKVDFLGSTLVLADLFDATKMGRIIDEIKTHVTLGQYVNIYDKSKNTELIVLLNNKIPDVNPLYVPRSLLRRLKVNPKVFKVDCPDVYAFKGIGWTKLAELVKPQRVEFSTRQLLSLSSRFIILEHEEDWEEICKTAEVPVHLIKCEEEDQGYVLEATTGGSLVLHQFLGHNDNLQGDDATISEEEFFEEVSRDGSSGVCICDLPGMGKSLLLANLATRMKQQNPDRLVVFIQMSHFTGFVVARKGDPAFVPDVSFAKKTLLEYLTPSHLEYFLLTVLLSKTMARVELFFDGFDEIQVGQVQIAKQLLTKLSELSNTRIFVTSRPNMRHELEASLHVISYDILPFSHANQIDFLTAFWRQSRPTNSEEKLREFAEFCVKELKTKLKENEREITGIPLQCQLVAEVFSREANIFAQPQRNVGVEELCKIESSIADLYTRYCDVRFSKVVAGVGADSSVKERVTMEAVDGGNDCLSEIQEMKMFHMLTALKLLFPHHDQLFNKVLEETATTCQLSSVLSAGILQQQFTENHPTTQFVHRTFAEYLVAEFFAKLLAGEMGQTSVHEQLIRLFLVEVMRSKEQKTFDFLSRRSQSTNSSPFTHSVILYFFNSVCESKRIDPEDEVLLKTFVSCVTADRLYDLLHAIIRENHVSICVLLNKLLSKVDPISLKTYKSRLVPYKESSHVSQLIICAAKYSSVFLIEQLFLLFRECFQIDLRGQDKQLLATSFFPSENHLRVAVIRSIEERLPNYEMIQFFVECAPTGVCHLQKCISRTEYIENPLEMEKLLSILRWLLDKYKNLATHEPLVLVHSESVHVNVMKLLLRKGVDPKAADKGRTIVHRGAQFMKGDHFDELCQSLIHEFNAAELFGQVPGRWNSPLPAILANRSITNQTTRMIYDVPWLDTSYKIGTKLESGTLSSHQRIHVDVNYSDEMGRTLLMCAVTGQRGIQTIGQMIDDGANVLAQDQDGNTFVHCATQDYDWYYSPEKYHEFVQLLICKQLGRAFQISNNLGRTPLHKAVTCTEFLQETLDLLVGHSRSSNTEQHNDNAHNIYVNLNAVDKAGESILFGAVRGRRSLALIQRLIGVGADWSIKTNNNQNLAHASVSHALLDHLKFFVELGCDINEMDADGNTVLQCAMMSVYYNSLLEIIQLLVANGARKENKNKEGETAYMIAVRKGVKNANILELLK